MRYNAENDYVQLKSNGQWVDWMFASLKSTKLYDNGTEYNPITFLKAPNMESMLQIVKNSNYISTTYSGGGDAASSIAFSNKITVRPENKVKIILTVTGGHATARQIKIMLGNNPNTDDVFILAPIPLNINGTFTKEFTIGQSFENVYLTVVIGYVTATITEIIIE